MPISLSLYVLRCENKAAHVCSSRCTIHYPIHTTGCDPRTCTKYKHPCTPCTYTYLHSILVHNTIVYIVHKRAPITTHSCQHVMYCTHLSVWSVELWASAATMYCAPSVPMELFLRLYAHVCVRERYSARSQLTMRDPMSARSYTHMHTCMPCTYTYLHSSAQRNSIYHAQTCPTTTHSCEQATCCTHSSVWSVELWASAAAICCAPSAPMELNSRLYAHVCVRRAIQRTCVDYDVRSHTYNRVRGHIHPCIRACRHTKYKPACMPCIVIPVHSAIVYTMRKRSPLLRTHANRL
jgi:hypothetical protein